MDTRDLLTSIAARLEANKAAIGLAGVSYPARNAVPASPWAMVRQSMTIPTTVVKARATQQIVRPAIDVVLLVTSDETSPGDAARLDGLIAPVLDLFDATAAGGHIAAALPGWDGPMHRVWQEALVRRVAVSWGETGYCHAAVITFDAEFPRSALEVSP